MQLIFSILLAVVSLLLLTIQKTYYQVPRYELKRRARSEDKLAQILYRAVAYESSLHVVLWTLIGMSVAGSFVLFSRTLSPIIALVIIAILTWWYFLWLPGGQVSRWSMTLTEKVTPAVAWITSHLHPLIDRVRKLLPKQDLNPNDIFETEDLLALLDHQQKQSGSRVPTHELEAAKRVLGFGHKLVRDVVVPRGELTLVSQDDPIGPILLTELHDSGSDNFIVFQGERNNIVGTLNLQAAVRAHGSRVYDAMQAKLVYVNESQTLADVLQAFRTTKAHTFMVINTFDEFIGIVTIEQILQEALGELSATNFEAFDSRGAVAAFQPALEPVIDAEPVGSEEPPEVTDENKPPSMDESEQETISSEPPEVVE